VKQKIYPIKPKIRLSAALGLRCLLYWLMSLTLAAAALHLTVFSSEGWFNLDLEVRYRLLMSSTRGASG
jgi:ABC-type antimicrobial peptide transport system permease subunit